MTKFWLSNKGRVNWFIAAVGVFALAAALPLLLQPGLLNTRGGGDSPFLLQRVQQLETALLDGHFPVRWMPDANYGYGYPFFNYYAPLSIYITAVFRLLGLSYVGAIEAAQIAGFLLAAGGMYWLARRWWHSSWVGLVTAVAYTFAPFHMVNIYVRGDSLAEFWAMAWYPWVILAADELWLADSGWQKQGRAIAFFALAYAALVLSHNISALIFSPFLLLYILLQWLMTNGQRRMANLQSPISGLLPFAAALLLGLALAAWFFVPALAEQGNAQLAPVTEGYFHYSNHFRAWDLVQSSLLFDYDVSGGGAFRMGLVQAVTAVLGLFVFLARARARAREGSPHDPVTPSRSHPVTPSPPLLRPSAPLLFTFLTLLVATFMITPLSRPLWDHLPLLSFTQFPWRFLSVQAFATALAAGGLALLPRPRLLALLLAGLLLFSGLGILRTDSLRLTDADVTAEKLAQYEWFTGNIGSTVSAEYLPPTMSPRPYTSRWLNTGQRHVARVLSGEISGYELAQFKTGRQAWWVTAVSPSTVQFDTLYWPGWVAKVNGRTAEIRPSPGSGLITLDLPAGEHIITLRLARPPLRLVAELVSLLALGIAGFLLRPYHFVWPKGFLVLAACLLLAIFWRLWPQPLLPEGTQTWDFAQLGYLHHAPNGIPFANGGLLHEYRYDRDEVLPGETLTIQMSTSGLRDVPTELALVTPAVLRWEGAALAPLVQAQPASQEPLLAYRLLIPDDAPPGLYIPRFRVGDLPRYIAQTPSGQSRDDLFLRPVRVLPVSNPANVTGLAVAPVRFTTQGETWSVNLMWATEKPLAQNYNVSLRFLDETGNLVAHYDTQPGFGFLPSSLWPAGRWISDRLTFPFPSEMPQRVALMAELYEIGGATMLYRRLGRLEQVGNTWLFREEQPQFALPEGAVDQETAVFLANGNPVIQLLNFSHLEQDGFITLNLTWQALASSPANYTRFAHVLDAEGNLFAQNDAMPQANSYPTSQWLPGEIIAEALILAVPTGEYRVVAGFYENLGDAWPRLTAVTGDGNRVPDNAVLLIEATETGD